MAPHAVGALRMTCILGTGKATALLLAVRGMKVVCADVDEAVSEVAAAIRHSGGSGRWMGFQIPDLSGPQVLTVLCLPFVCGLRPAVAQVCDMSKEASAQQLVDTCVREFGHMDVMFANAGVAGTMTPLLEQDTEEWERVFRVNVLGVFWCLRAAASRSVHMCVCVCRCFTMGGLTRMITVWGSMVDQGTGGSILFTASVAGLRAGAGATPYSATKAAVNSLCQTGSWGLYKSGIRVNSVCPGLIRTGMTELLFLAAEAAGKAKKVGQVWEY